MDDSARSAESKYAALIGDICGSRHLERRSTLQQQLEAALEAISGELEPRPASRLVLTLGDEFQGLFASAAAAVGAVLELETRLAGGIRLRYAVGWGGLSTPLKPRALGMDGPCFHVAREAMKRAKQEDRWLVLAGLEARPAAIANGVAGLIGAVRRTWTPTQAETVGLMQTRTTLKQVAAARGVATSTVHKSLRGALYEPVREAQEALLRLLDEVR